MNRVIHFDIQANDVDRAIAFYESVFGWSFNKWDGPIEYWMVTTGSEDEPGINGGLSKREVGNVHDNMAVVAFTCTVDVESVDETIKKVLENGGSVLMEKSPVPGIGWMANCVDTEDNVFGLMQDDPNAGM